MYFIHMVSCTIKHIQKSRLKGLIFILDNQGFKTTKTLSEDGIILILHSGQLNLNIIINTLSTVDE